MRASWCVVDGLMGGLECGSGVKNGGLKIVKNGPRVWAFCKIEFPGIQKPVQILTQKSGFFKKCGNRGVGVIWSVGGRSVGFYFRCVGSVAWGWWFLGAVWVLLLVALAVGSLFLRGVVLD